jgi:alcohol dehydrogenase, propanol-preferring
MRAMLLSTNGPIESAPLRLVSLPDPEPGPGEVRLRVSCCAICRTDLHVIEGDLPVQRMPVVPGHQVVGRIDKVGPGCTRLEPGQRVGVAWLRFTCGSCAHCAAGQENLCASQRFTGYHADGGYAELCLIREDFAYALPDGFDDVSAAPLLCAGIVGYRALKRADLPERGRLAIYGFGSSAHVILQVALARGAEVFVVTRDARHRELARQMGASWAGEHAEELPVLTHSAILFAPVGELVPPALRALEKGGTLALAGIHLSDIPSISYEDHLFYEKNLRSVTANTRADGYELLELAARIPIRPRTTLYTLTEANRALSDLKADRISGTGVLLVAEN